MATNILFNDQDYPEVVEVANELAELEKRKPHDSLKLLILEQGRKKIERLKLEQGLTS